MYTTTTRIADFNSKNLILGDMSPVNFPLLIFLVLVTVVTLLLAFVKIQEILCPDMNTTALTILSLNVDSTPTRPHSFCFFVFFIFFTSSPGSFQMKTPPSQRSKKQALEEQEKAKTKERERNVITSLQGCYVEMGMLGITHTFGAVSVLEIRYLKTNKEQMLMSCLNLLKISLSKWWR